MSLMTRRRMMGNSERSNVWEWDYTKGLLQNNGCVILSESGAINETLTGNSLRFTGSGYRFYAPPFRYIEQGIVEVEVLFSDVSNNQNFRVCIGNGTNGTQIMYTLDTLRLHDNSSPINGTPLMRLSHNVKHNIKIEHNETTFNLYVDGTKIISNRTNSGTLNIDRGTFLCPQKISSGYVDLFSARVEKVR